MFSFHKPKVYRSSTGCCICKAKSSSSRFTDSKKYEDDFFKCFLLAERRTGEICNACVLLVKRWKKLPVASDRNWSHVSVFLPKGSSTYIYLRVITLIIMASILCRWLMLGLVQESSPWQSSRHPKTRRKPRRLRKSLKKFSRRSTFTQRMATASRAPPWATIQVWHFYLDMTLMGVRFSKIEGKERYRNKGISLSYLKLC